MAKNMDDGLPIYPKAALDRGFANVRKYQRLLQAQYIEVVCYLLALPPSQDRECAVAAALTLHCLSRIKQGSIRP